MKAKCLLFLPGPMKQSNYYRRITELLPKSIAKTWQKWVKKPLLNNNLYSFFIVFLLITGIFLGIIAYLLSVKYEAVKQKRNDLVDQLGKWERVALVHPNYPDAYFRAAYFAYEIRDTKKARYYLQKALVLDPGFTAAYKLMKLIEGN